MSAEAAPRIREKALGTVAESAWAQWAVLTGAAVPASQARAWTIIDPEGLILASFTAGDRERRLEDMAASWAYSVPELMSLLRLRALAADFPTSVEEKIGVFARAAVAGGDKRWKRWPSRSNARHYEPRLKAIEPLKLLDGPALTLRLRAGFGVNAKAEILSLLLGFGGAAAGLKVMAAATAYTERAIRNATDDMVLGGFIREIEGRPSSYYADPDAWAHVLRTHRPDRSVERPVIPRWWFWGAVYSFLADVIAWAEEAEREGWSSYVMGSRARDLVARHERRLRQAQVEEIDALSVSGPEDLGYFEELVDGVRRWAKESLYPSK